MIVAIDQPHYLPWLGYLDRMRQADLFIVLDHVQFERRNYQNRTRILVEGEARWLSVPVVQRSQLERVHEKQIANGKTDDRRYWGDRHFHTMAHAYRTAPYFKSYASELQGILQARCRRLVDLDQLTLDFLRRALDIRTPLISSSSLGVKGARSEMILNLCRTIGADTYLAGMGGSRQYLDNNAFEQAGIAVAWQDFEHPVYAQCSGSGFTPGLSAIDLLFNHGPHSRDILAGKSRHVRVPALA